MEIKNPITDVRCSLLVPAFAGVLGGVCPQAGYGRLRTSVALAGVGHRSWSTPIT